jgi:hypothetical protein
MMSLASGGGWAAHSSHSFFFLMRFDAIDQSDVLIDCTSGRLAIHSANATRLAFFDGTFRSFGDDTAQLGWQILEFHFDGDASSATAFIGGVQKGGALAYSPKAVGPGAGVVRLGSDISDGQTMDCALGEVILVSRATGHTAGVTSAVERDAVRTYLRRAASNLGVSL